MNLFQRIGRWFDDYQQSRPWVAFPVAVGRKYADDRGSTLSALIAYYGFLSLFPLLLVFVGVLGLALRGNSELREDILDSALAQFPVIGDQIKRNVTALTGRGAGVAVGFGTLGSLWAGLRVTQAAQIAMNDVWDVPFKERPRFVESRVRGLLMLTVFGAITLTSTFLTGLGTVEGAALFPLRILGFLASIGLNLVLYLVAFRVLTDQELTWRDVFIGAAVGALLWTGLQTGGGYIVNHEVKNASALYGFFGFVIALFAWMYLGASLTLLSAEINVVRKHRLWPRTLVAPLTEEDKRALERSAKVEERREEEQVDVSFGGDDSAPDSHGPPPSTAHKKGDAEAATGALKGGVDRGRSSFRPGAIAAAGLLGMVIGVALSRRMSRTKRG